LDALLDQLC